MLRILTPRWLNFSFRGSVHMPVDILNGSVVLSVDSLWRTSPKRRGRKTPRQKKLEVRFGWPWSNVAYTAPNSGMLTCTHIAHYHAQYMKVWQYMMQQWMRNRAGRPISLTQKMIGPNAGLDTHYQTQKLPQLNHWGENSYRTQKGWVDLVKKPEIKQNVTLH